jgi:drug/metabolite transporter (DMT)-like permease
LLHILVTIFAGFFYSLMSVFIKMAYAYSNETTITFFRFFSSLAILAPVYFITGRPNIKTSVPFLHLLRGFFGFLMFTLYTISLQILPVENALALNSTYPFFVPIILFFFFRESVPKNVIVGIIVGFIGVYAVVNPSTSEYFNWAAIFALLSAVFSAASNVTIRTLRKTENSFSIVFYFFLFATVVSFFYMVSNEQEFNIKVIWLLLGIAITSLGSQQCLSYVLKYLHPNMVSSLMYSAIVFGFIFSWLFWGKVPTYMQLVGVIIIIVGNLMLD